MPGAFTGIWSCSNTAIATVNAWGVLLGVSGGPVSISYNAYSATCGGLFSATTSVTVLNTIVPPSVIVGPASLSVGTMGSYSNSVLGGTWSVSPSSVASIDSVTGLLSATGAGTAMVNYMVTGCGLPASVSYPVTVTPFDGISGMVNLSSTPYFGSVKVWLIKYVAPMLTAVDSAVVTASGTSAFYQFPGIVADSYRVKSVLLGAPTTGSGYIPSYHTGSFYWSTATVIAHAAGAADVNKDINMAYGTVTSGPGFIGGDVTAGANKGTASGIPVGNLMMYVFNTATSQLMQAVRTDASGHYSFADLPVGTYYVFPDSLNYLTTPFINLNVTASSPTISAANFVQHTLSGTITPDDALAVANVGSTNSQVIVFPNPAANNINISWQLSAAEQASVAIYDMVGNEVYTATINMAATTGNSRLNLSSLADGLYTISVKSSTLNYKNMLQIKR